MSRASKSRQGEHIRRVGAGPDLSAEVTAFITTVGAPSFAACLEHLEAQDVILRLRVVEGVAPLSRALQLMIDQCTTPYFVQVDEDMLLDSDAVRRLLDLMRAEWPNVAVVVGLLKDAHMGRPIEGVKLNRLDFVRQFSWGDHATVLDRNDAIVAAGYRIARRPVPDSGDRLTFGVHVLDQTPAVVFDRYRHLERLRRARPEEFEWFARYPAEFLRRLMRTGDEVDYYALMGILAAATERDGSDDHQEWPPPRDFRELGADQAIGAARRFRDAVGRRSNGG